MASPSQPPSWQQPGPSGSGARQFPPPAPAQRASALDATLGALVAESTTGVGSSPAAPRSPRSGVLGVIAGVVLIIGAGLGIGWAVGRATRDDVTAPATESDSSVPGVLSEAPPSADTSGAAAGPAATDGPGVLTAATQAPTPTAADSPPTTAASTATTGSTATTADGAVTTTPDASAPVSDPAGVAISAAPVASTTNDPTTGSIPASAPDPAVAPTVAPAADAKLPNAVAYLEDGRITIRGSFVDEEALNAAVTKLRPLGPNGLVLEAQVDPAASGSEEIPVLVPGAALFESGSAILGSGGQPLLDQFAAAMKATPSARLVIKGHTDSRGSDAYNFALSQQRIAAVFAYLTANGVDGRRLELAPRGETEPIADNETPEGQARNRRVELIFSA